MVDLIHRRRTRAVVLRWDESPALAESFMKVKEAQGIVDGNAHVYRKLMKGTFDNKDVLV